MKEIIHNRSLLLLGLAESISNVGNWITTMALYAIIVFHGEGGVMESSGILLAGLGPMLVFSPVAGWLSDRFDRKWLMIISQAMSALPIIAIMIVGEGPIVYVLLAIQTTFTTLMLPARQASVPMLVDKQHLTQANALLQQINSFVKIGGPILGGAIVGLLGAQNAMLLDVLSFALAACVLLLLPSLPPPREKAMDAERAKDADSPPTRPETVGLFLRRSARLRLLFLATFLAIVVIMGFDVLGSIYVRDVLLADEGLFGALIGLVGFGSVLSAGWLMLRRRQQDPWQDLTWGLVLLSGIPLLMAVGFWIGDPQTAKWVTAFGSPDGGTGQWSGQRPGGDAVAVALAAGPAWTVGRHLPEHHHRRADGRHPGHAAARARPSLYRPILCPVSERTLAARTGAFHYLAAHAGPRIGGWRRRISFRIACRSQHLMV